MSTFDLAYSGVVVALAFIVVCIALGFIACWAWALISLGWVS